MGRRWPIALAALLLLFSNPASCQSDEFGISDEGEEIEVEADEQKPFLLARKFLPGKDLVIGRNTTIAIELYNAGKSAAYDVTVKDSTWDAAFFRVVEDSLTKAVGRIPAGATERISLYVTPLQAGEGIAYPAKITYKLEQDASAEQITWSTPLSLAIITPFQLNVRTVLRWGSYLTLGAFTTLEHWRNAAIITTLFGAATLGVWVYTSVNEANKSSKYRKALSEVEKMK